MPLLLFHDPGRPRIPTTTDHHISMSLTLISSLVTPYLLETIPDKRVHRMSPSVRIANSPNQTARLMRQKTRDKPRGGLWEEHGRNNQ
jgi:hypothetical protein